METAGQIASSLMDFGFNREFRGDYYKASEWLQGWWQGQMKIANHRITWGTWSAVLATYGLGQFFSLAFKREVLAGFLAILLSVLLAAWSLVVFFWQLNPILFVLPLAAGALAATWLRMPHWLVGKRSLRHWLLPAMSLGLPVLFISLYLPFARLAQLDLPMPRFPYLQESLEASLKVHEQKKPARQELTLLLEQFDPEEPLEEWLGRMEAIQAEYVSSDSSQAWNRSSDLRRELETQVQQLLQEGKLDEAWRYLVVMAKINISFSLLDEPFEIEKIMHESLIEWAQAQGQSSILLKQAISELEACFVSAPHPRERILSDYVRTREVMLEKELPYYLKEKNANYLPFLANKFSWERDRGLLALHYFASQAINYCDAVVALAKGESPSPEIKPGSVRKLLWRAPYTKLFAVNRIAFADDWQDFIRACNWSYAGYTSLLAAKEFGDGFYFFSFLGNWMRAETNRRALLIELALLAFRLDHGEFPEELAGLVPEYLEKMPLDPYSGREFVYHSTGLKYPLVLSDVPPRSDVGTIDEIPANTPLFWSVGDFNRRLEETTLYESDGEIFTEGYGGEGGYSREFGTFGGSYGATEPFQGKSRKVYSFDWTYGSEYSWRNLVYVLPTDGSENEKIAE